MLDFISHNFIALAADPQDSGIVKGLTTIFGNFQDILKLGLQIGAAIAFVTIIYAGFLYLTGADNVSKQKEALAWIRAAVEGLAILAFGYLIFTTLNPSLLTIKEIQIAYYQDTNISQVPLADYKFDNSNKILSFLPISDQNPAIGDIIGYRFLSTTNSPIGPGLYGDCKSPHGGIDIKVGAGTDIFATHPGTVTIASSPSNQGLGFTASIYGQKAILITGENGTVSIYGHLSANLVADGDRVTAGQLIGKSGGDHCNRDNGDEGSCFGAHLHYEVRQNGKAQDVNYMFPQSAASVSEQLLNIQKKAESLGLSDLPPCQ